VNGLLSVFGAGVGPHYPHDQFEDIHMTVAVVGGFRQNPEAAVEPASIGAVINDQLGRVEIRRCVHLLSQRPTEARFIASRVKGQDRQGCVQPGGHVGVADIGHLGAVGIVAVSTGGEQVVVESQCQGALAVVGLYSQGMYSRPQGNKDKTKKDRFERRGNTGIHSVSLRGQIAYGIGLLSRVANAWSIVAH